MPVATQIQENMPDTAQMRMLRRRRQASDPEVLRAMAAAVPARVWLNIHRIWANGSTGAANKDTADNRLQALQAEMDSFWS